MEWYDPCSHSTCGHQTEPPGAPLPQWNGRGRENNLAPFEGLGQFLQSCLRGWGFNRPSLCIRCASCDEPLKGVGSLKYWLQLDRTGVLGFWALCAQQDCSAEVGRAKTRWPHKLRCAEGTVACTLPHTHAHTQIHTHTRRLHIANSEAAVVGLYRLKFECALQMGG